MSLQQLKSNPGSKMPLDLRLVSFEPYQQGQYGFYTKAQLTDGFSTEQVLIDAGRENFQFQQQHCGMAFPFVLKSKQSGKYVNLSGYCNNAQQNQPVNISQPVQQAMPQQAPAQPRQDPTPARIARACVVNERDGLCQQIAQEYQSSGMTSTRIADMFATWIEHGTWPAVDAAPQTQPVNAGLGPQQGVHDPNAQIPVEDQIQF